MTGADVPAIIQQQEQGAPVTPGVQRPSEEEMMRALVEEVVRRLQTDPEYRERAKQLEQGGNPLEQVPPPAESAPGPGSQNELAMQRLLALLGGQ
jgi:hypothetical protein